MSTQPESNNFFADFLEDYFAECEEHLTVVRRELLALEPFVGKPTIERSIVHELFRSFHSIKGLSGMVGVKVAEELAHEMESYLRVLRDRQVVLSASGFDALLSATKILEQAIAAHRSHSVPPEIATAIGQIQAAISEEQTDTQPKTTIAPSQLKLQPEIVEQIARAIDNGAKGWHFTFIPTPQLSTQGMNVNTIRQRLQAIGELIHAAPRMTSDGKIEFDFIVTTNADETAFSGWEKDGLTWISYPDSQPLPTTVPPQTHQVTQPPVSEETPTSQALEPAEAARQRRGEETSVDPTLPQSAVAKPRAIETESQNPAPATPLISQPSNVVRVDLPKLDDLMRMVGDLVISRARLEDKLTRLKESVPLTELRNLREINQTLERQLRDLREGVMRVRLVPIGEIFARMQFVVRDLVRESQKQVGLEVSGQETEIDKFVVERMMDPLLHLVRNAVSHGIESRQERIAAGKSPEGKITLRAKTAGEMVTLEIEDDGRGIDIEKTIARGRDRGLISDNDSSFNRENGYEPIAILEILCSPGFSTRDVADLASGRGVGMAIVKNTIHELGGLLNFESEKGKGTRFIIELPLTLAIADALIVSVAGEVYAIPQSSIREAIEVYDSEVTAFENNEIISYRGSILPLIRLASLFGLTQTEARKPSRKSAKIPEKKIGSDRPSTSPHSRSLHLLRVIVVGSGLNAVGIAVDRIIGQREIVVRALTDPLVQVIGISGATELGDGRVVLILDVSALVRHAIKLKINT